MKKRLIVMNGQKLAQNDFTGEWKTEKVTKALGIKPGIYNLYNAIDADKSKEYLGEVLYVDKKEKIVYQNNDSQYIKHDLNYFNEIPETGLMINIKYENNKTITFEVSKNLSHKIKM